MTGPGTDGATQRRAPRTAVLWQPTSTPFWLAAGVAPPYVLAGHSSGGVYTRIFAGMYPTEVAGMVMLDAQPAEVYTQLPGWRTFYSLYKRGEALGPSLARVGVARIGYDIAPSGLPPEERAEQEADSVHGGVLPCPSRRDR